MAESERDTAGAIFTRAIIKCYEIRVNRETVVVIANFIEFSITGVVAKSAENVYKQRGDAATSNLWPDTTHGKRIE